MSRNRRKKHKFRMPPENAQVVPFTGHYGRYVVIDGDTGELYDSANGYGYTSMQKAYAALAYKRKRASGQPTRGDLMRFWARQNEAAVAAYDDACEMFIKEIARGEDTCEDLFASVLENVEHTSLPKGVTPKIAVKYL